MIWNAFLLCAAPDLAQSDAKPFDGAGRRHRRRRGRHDGDGRERRSDAIRTQIESFGNNQLMLRPGMRLGPGQKVGAPTKLEDAEALVNQLAGIEAVAPQTSKSLTIVAEGRNWQTSVIGTDNNYFTIDNRELESGRYFEDAELMAGSAVCVIGGRFSVNSSARTSTRSGKSLAPAGSPAAWWGF